MDDDVALTMQVLLDALKTLDDSALQVMLEHTTGVMYDLEKLPRPLPRVEAQNYRESMELQMGTLSKIIRAVQWERTNRPSG